MPAPQTIRQAAIVGGLGTRLGNLTVSTLKPLLPCGDRPFLAWLLHELLRFGIEEALLLTGHRAEAIEAALREMIATLPRRLRITCNREQQQACTGGALFQARHCLEEHFLLCNGDSWFDFDIARLFSDAADDTANVLVRMALCRLDDASRYGVVEMHADRITGFTNVQRQAIPARSMPAFTCSTDVRPTPPHRHVRWNPTYCRG